MSYLDDSIKKLAESAGVDLLGSVNLKELDFPDSFDPYRFLPEAKTGLVIGCRVGRGVINNLPQTRNAYMMQFRSVNARMNALNYELCSLLEDEGFMAFGAAATAHPGDRKRLAADLSHRHLAVAAGLGRMGINNLVLTPEFGSRVRFSTLITTAELPAPRERAENLCTECLQCVKVCPVNALADWEDNYSSVRGWLINKEACFHHMFLQLEGSRCGLCIKACPLS